MKKVYKKKIVVTGGNGLLGSHFRKKYKQKYIIIKYPHRIEYFKKFQNWLKNKKFNYFIHFAAITKNESKKFKKTLNLINVKSSINIINSLNRYKIKNFNYFLFISSSHVYGYSNKKISEKKIRKPANPYGNSKKKVEDFILKNNKKLYFRCGIARVFNTTGYKQKKGNFVPDMLSKIKNSNHIDNVNQFRDFIHIDDVTKSIELMLRKKIKLPINISSGKKINLIKVCKIINSLYLRKKISYGLNKGKNIFGDNNLLKKNGISSFKDNFETIKAYKP